MALVVEAIHLTRALPSSQVNPVVVGRSTPCY